MSVTRIWRLATLTAVLAVACGTLSASGQEIRRAKVGDPMSSLLTGLIAVNGGPIGACSQGGPVFYYVNYLVPARTDASVFGLEWRNLDLENASFLGFMAGNQVGSRIVMLVAFDEQHPSVPVTVFADTRGAGTITMMWPAVEAPSLCSIAQQLRARR